MCIDISVSAVFNYLSESYLEKQSQSSYNAKPSQSSIGMFVCVCVCMRVCMCVCMSYVRPSSQDIYRFVGE